MVDLYMPFFVGNEGEEEGERRGIFPPRGGKEGEYNNCFPQ